MASPLKIVKPLQDVSLISTSVPEDDYPAWVSGQTYAVGDRVIRTNVHKIYQRTVAGAGTTAPENDAVNWTAVSPTNQWKLFDTSNTTATTYNGTITYTVRSPSIVRAIGLLGLKGSTLRVRVIDPVEGTVYDKTTPLSGVIPESTWWAYYFWPNTPVKSQVLTDLPPYPNADIVIDITPLSGSAAIATFVIGTVINVGLGIESGARVGITDYSRKETNAFGDTVLIQRAFKKRASFEIHVERSEEDAVFELLTDLRATPALYIGLESRAITFIFGFYKDFECVLPYTHRSVWSLDLEGLS